MTEPRKLAHPPIKQAMLEIRFKAEGIELNDLKGLAASIGTKNINEINEHEMMFNLGPEPSVGKSATRVKGFETFDEPRRHVYSVQLDRFFMAQRGEYGDYDELEAAAKKGWNAILACGALKAVTRVGLRYINQFKGLYVDSAMGDMGTRPKVANDELGLPRECFSRSLLPIPKFGLTAIVAQAWQQLRNEAGWGLFTLDIDVFRAVTIEPEKFDQIWPLLRDMRQCKNELFFGSVSEKLLEAFQ